MSRIGLAFSSFFRLLFGKRLDPAVARFLPDEFLRLPEPGSAAPIAKPAEPPSEPEAKPKKADPAAAQRDGALALLALFQRDGRLIDFLREPLDGFSDADIGAAARDVHRGCAKVLAQVFTLEAVLPGADDARVTVPRGFDPTEIRIIGEAKGDPPFSGALRHHGWRAERAQLPSLTEGVDRAIVAPAEVEV